MAPASPVDIALMRTDRGVRDASMLLRAHSPGSGEVADDADPAFSTSGPGAALLLAQLDRHRVGRVGLPEPAPVREPERQRACS